MENRNIYKMDDVLIIASFLMLVPTVFISWPWLITLPQAGDMSRFIQSAPIILGPRLNMVLLYFSGSILAQIIGRIIRKQEKQALDVLDTILYMRNTTVEQLSANLNISSNKAEKIARKLSRIRALNISMEGSTVKMDSPLSSFSSSVTPLTAHTSPNPQSQTPPTEAPQTSDPQSPESPASAPQADSNEINRSEIKAKLKDKSLSFQEKMTYLSQLAETQKEGGDSGEFEKKTEAFKNMDPKTQNKLKRNTILIFILFMTPLWPIALIMIILFVIKQARGQETSVQAKDEEEK